MRGGGNEVGIGEDGRKAKKRKKMLKSCKRDVGIGRDASGKRKYVDRK